MRGREGRGDGNELQDVNDDDGPRRRNGVGLTGFGDRRRAGDGEESRSGGRNAGATIAAGKNCRVGSLLRF